MVLMSDFQIELPHSPQVFDELKKMVREMKSAIEARVGSSAKVRHEQAEFDEDNFSQNLVITAEKGEIEVMVLWSKDDQRADVMVGGAVTAKGPVAYLPLVLALVFAFVFDQSLEWLPVFRGIRVFLGALCGFLVATGALAVLGVALGLKKAEIDPKITQEVEAAVRSAISDRGLVLAAS